MSSVSEFPSSRSAVQLAAVSGVLAAGLCVGAPLVNAGARAGMAGVAGVLAVGAGILFVRGTRKNLAALRRRHEADLAQEGAARREAEAKLKDSECRMARIVAQVPGTLFEFRPDVAAGRDSPFPAPGQENQTDEVWRQVHPEDRARVAASFAKATKLRGRWECDYRVQLAHGTMRWVHGTALPERNADEALTWHGVVTDITNRKNAEQAHEEGRVLLQSVFSSVDLGVFVVELGPAGTFRFMEVNPAYERLTGISAAEIRGLEPRELVPMISAEMAECLRASFVRGVASTQPIEYEEPFFARGKLIWLLTRLTPIRDAAGNVVRLVGRSLEITERKSIELRFQSLTERLQLATEAAQVGIWDHDVLQNRSVWDAKMHALYGVKAGAFDGSLRAWRERVHPDDVERVDREMRATLEEGKPLSTSFRIIRADGEERKIRASAHTQRNPAGRATRIVGVNWDVTAEDRAQSEIARARDEAEQLNVQLEEALTRANLLAQEAGAATVAKSEFLANMSHEIRTPLNAVIGMCGLLLGTELSGEQREFAETIRSSGDGLLDLLNDILDYSKIESGRLDLEVRPFDLHECIESAVDVMGGRAAEKKIDLIYSFAPGVPEAVTGDDTRLRQVLVNLLSNAVKFTAQGEVFLEISIVGRSEKGSRLRFAVRDTGIGIPAARMDRLFRTFSQVDASTTRQYGGTGLGLAICKRIVELMGGRIWAESETGRGSVFCFEIDAEPHASVGRMFTAARTAALGGRRVLIVDDNATQRRVLAEQCTAWGMSALAAGSGAEALGSLSGGDRFDLALIDADMPTMSGAELIAEIRQKFTAAQLPIAMLSVPGRPRVASALGVGAVLSKPIKVATLFEYFSTAVRGGAAASPEPSAPVAAISVAAIDRPLAILLAEDNPVNQRVAILMLQRLGYRADLAANGREVLEAVARRRYDLILMDVQMPEMDGLQAAREVCARFKPDGRPRIVAMTANVSTGDRAACLEAGMDDFMPKPVREADLRVALLATPVRVVESAA